MSAALDLHGYACDVNHKNFTLHCMRPLHIKHSMLYCYCASFLIQYSSKCGFLHGLEQSVQTMEVQIVMVSL